MKILRRSEAGGALVLAGVAAALIAAHAPGASSGSAPGSPPPASAVRSVRVLVQTGDRAPGGGVFTQLSDPALNNRGEVAFVAQAAGPSARQALYLHAGERLATLAASGQTAPAGGVFHTFSDVSLNDRGTAVFLGRTAERTAGQGLYLARGGRILTVAAVGGPAPGGGAFTDFANPTINAQDVVAFVGRLPGREGIFTSSEGTMTAAVLAGQPAPTGGVFQFFLDGSPSENDRGDLAFVASTTSRSTQGVYVLTGKIVVPVVTTDDEAPVGGPFTEFGFVTLTNHGTVGFIGRTARSRIREGIYATGRAALVLLARQGQAAGGEVLTTFTNLAMNEAEDVVFEPSAPDPIPRALYLARRTGVVPLLRAGDRAPGGRRFTTFSAPSLNDHGQAALVAATDDGRSGIYVVTVR